MGKIRTIGSCELNNCEACVKKVSTESVAFADLGYCEGLCWHDQELWWSDFLSRKVSSVGSDAKPCAMSMFTHLK